MSRCHTRDLLLLLIQFRHFSTSAIAFAAASSPPLTRRLTGLEADVLNVWGDFLEALRETNKELIGMTDAKLGQNLDAENRLLKKITTSITGTSTIAKFYKKSFEMELKAEKKLLT